MSSVTAAGGRVQLAQKRSTIAATMRAIAVFEGAFSRRDIVGCEHSGAALREPSCGHLEDRIRAQAVVIVRVFVDYRDEKHPQPQNLAELVLDPCRVTPIDQARRQPLARPKRRSTSRSTRTPPSDRRQRAAVERDAYFLAANGWQRGWQKGILVYGGVALPYRLCGFCSYTRIMHALSGLRYIRRPKSPPSGIRRARCTRPHFFVVLEDPPPFAPVCPLPVSTAVTSVIEFGLIVISVGLPFGSFACTRNDPGTMWMSVKPALVRLCARSC